MVPFSTTVANYQLQNDLSIWELQQFHSSINTPRWKGRRGKEERRCCRGTGWSRVRQVELVAQGTARRVLGSLKSREKRLQLSVVQA